MLTRITYFKRDNSGDLVAWAAEYEDDLKLKIHTSQGEETETQFNTLEELQAKLGELVKEQEKNGLHLAAKQTFIDPENPTVDELESQILLRYKIMGITDTISLKNARKEAIKMLKNESGEREDYSLETMEFVVDVKDHDSLKKLLEWQLENFEEFVDAVCENYGIDYGYIDADGSFTEYEEDDIPTYRNEEIVYREAAKYPDLLPLIEEFVRKTNELNQKGDTRYKNEETPFASTVAFILAMQDVKYLRNYLDYCNCLEDALRHYYDRYREAGHIPQLFAKYGFDKDEPLVMELIAAQMAMRDNQHFEDELSFLMEIGLEEALEDEEFVEALFKAAIQRGRDLVTYYGFRGIDDWMAEYLVSSMEIMGLDSNKTAIMELITSDDEIPTFEEFQEMIEDMDDEDDDDDEEDEDEDDDDEDEDDDDEDEKSPKKKIKASEYKQLTKDLEAMDFAMVKEGIDYGMPLNEYQYKGQKALDYFLSTFDGAKKDDKAYIKKFDEMMLMLINSGADAEITDFEYILAAYILDLPQTLNYFISKGFDINDTVNSNGSNILDANIYTEEVVSLLLEKGADPARIPTALHSALKYLSLDMVKRFVEEYKVPLQNLNEEGETPLEDITGYAKVADGWVEKYREEVKDPKKKDKRDHKGKTPGENLAELEERYVKRDYMIELTKNLRPLFAEATTPEEQASLDKQLLEVCDQSEVKISLLQKLIDAKANPDATNENGQTPLHLIAKQMYPHLVQQALDVLRKAGAKADVVDKFGRTPLFYFCLSYHGGNQAFKELVSYGINPAHKDNDGYNALGYLISISPKYKEDSDLHHKCESSIQSMMYGGIPLVDIDPDGDTIYHGLLNFADCFELDEMFAFIKKQGVDINAKNKNGDTALHVAAKDPDERDFCDNYVQKLVDAGADIHVTDADGKTPLETSTHPDDDGEYLSEDYEPDTDDDEDEDEDFDEDEDEDEDEDDDDDE